MDRREVDRKPLGALDAVGLIVGIIIGAGIFEAPHYVVLAVSNPAGGIMLWLIGAVVAICGALCYAELAASFMTDAGEAEYFTQAFGPFAGWYFTWMQLVSVRTAAAVVTIAYVFASNAINLGSGPTWLYAVGAVVILTGVNALGLRPGKWTQNLLTVAKLLALSAVIVATLRAPSLPVEVWSPPAPGSLAVALIMVFYAFAGWHEAAYIVAELREPRRSLPLAMFVGVGIVTALYLTVNAAALHGLGPSALRLTENFGVDLLKAAGFDGRWFAAVAVIVTLGSINGTILSGSRLFATAGAIQPGYGWLSRGRTRRDAPLVALAVQAAICLAMIAAVESVNPDGKGFNRVVRATSPVLWVMFLMTGIALVVLRRRQPDRPRPYRVPLYPLLPIVFIGSCGFMLYESIEYAVSQWQAECWLALGLLLAGIPYWAWATRSPHVSRTPAA